MDVLGGAIDLAIEDIRRRFQPETTIPEHPFEASSSQHQESFIRFIDGQSDLNSSMFTDIHPIGPVSIDPNSDEASQEKEAEKGQKEEEAQCATS